MLTAAGDKRAAELVQAMWRRLPKHRNATVTPYTWRAALAKLHRRRRHGEI